MGYRCEQSMESYYQRWVLLIVFPYSDSYQNIRLTYLSDFNYRTSYIRLLIVQ
jgi:hypothetical protein